MNDGGWMYANSLMAAAREVSRYFYNYGSISCEQIASICHKFAVYPERMSLIEQLEFNRLVSSFDMG